MFGVEVPVLAHPLAEPDKGAGIAMCCTFGDLTDVSGGASCELPVRTVIGRDGRISARPPEWLTGEPASAAYDELAGKTTFSAREAMVGAAARVRRPGRRADSRTQRMANFYEKGDKPLEIVATRQWYIRNGGRDAELRDELLDAGRRDRTGSRPTCGTATTTGSSGLNGDWLVSPPAVLRRAVPGLVPARRRRRARLRRPDRARRGRAAGRPVAPTSRRATTRTSGRSPAASSATPTSWTPGRRRR